MTPPVAVAGRSVEVAYHRRVVLAASDFTVPSGTVTTVIGPNGSGKSTLLHAIAGLVETSSGTLEILGDRPGAARERVAYVLQATRVNERLPVTVREVVAMGAYAARGMFGRLGVDERRRVADAMDRVGVSELAGRHLRELSGGQRQRVFVAQGLAQDAELLMLDEPITGLDIPSHERIDAVIDEERARGVTVLLTTHDISEARRSDHVLLLAGRVVASGPPGEVLTDARLLEAYGPQLLHADQPLALDDAHHRPVDAGREPGRGR